MIEGEEKIEYQFQSINVFCTLSKIGMCGLLCKLHIPFETKTMLQRFSYIISLFKPR